MQTFRRGSRSAAVGEIQYGLAVLGLLSWDVAPANLDGVDRLAEYEFDEPTELAVRTFQQQRGLRVDGVVGVETTRALRAARFPNLGDRLLVHNATQRQVGDDVAALQNRLLELGYAPGHADGIFGPGTETALRAFQRESGLQPDGICGPSTLKALQRLGRPIVGGRPQMMREWAAVQTSGPNLLGKRIVLDPAHGGADTGVNVDGVTEADLVWDLANRLEGRLTALGVTTWLTRGPRNGESDETRANFANSQGADLVISLHIDGAPSAHASGVATYYYGGALASSTIGERLADLVQREVVARTGMADCQIHPKTWDLLRLTSMPAVRVETGYLTSEPDRAKLLQPGYRDLIAEALLVGIQRLYLPQDADPPTGVLKLPLAV
jgi:N-acetylmuramoyl-L-alanine amidase